ncbi:HIT family protein, partial [Streptomyces sp. SID3343]|uniref:HIT family protein n=1 Tax=Streptomyces sp. SID3343 TaxID=2690260 RepID=UPI00136EDD24
MTVQDCHTCAQEAEFAELPPRERIAADTYWRVAHSFTTSLPGWLVLVPRRHVTALHDLTDDEAAALGRWQVRLSRALRATTGCAKTYVAQFAEAEGFAHVHFHIVPRPVDLAESLRGPRVFGLLDERGRAVTDPVSTDALALRIRAHLAEDAG